MQDHGSQQLQLGCRLDMRRHSPEEDSFELPEDIQWGKLDDDLITFGSSIEEIQSRPFDFGETLDGSKDKAGVEAPMAIRLPSFLLDDEEQPQQSEEKSREEEEELPSPSPGALERWRAAWSSLTTAAHLQRMSESQGQRSRLIQSASQLVVALEEGALLSVGSSSPCKMRIVDMFSGRLGVQKLGTAVFPLRIAESQPNSIVYLVDPSSEFCEYTKRRAGFQKAPNVCTVVATETTSALALLPSKLDLIIISCGLGSLLDVQTHWSEFFKHLTSRLNNSARVLIFEPSIKMIEPIACAAESAGYQDISIFDGTPGLVDSAQLVSCRFG